MFGYLNYCPPLSFLPGKKEKKILQLVIQPYSFATATKQKEAQGYRRKLLLMLCLFQLRMAGKEAC